MRLDNQFLTNNKGLFASRGRSGNAARKGLNKTQSTVADKLNRLAYNIQTTGKEEQKLSIGQKEDMKREAKAAAENAINRLKEAGSAFTGPSQLRADYNKLYEKWSKQGVNINNLEETLKGIANGSIEMSEEELTTYLGKQMSMGGLEVRQTRWEMGTDEDGNFYTKQNETSALNNGIGDMLGENVRRALDVAWGYNTVKDKLKEIFGEEGMQAFTKNLNEGFAANMEDIKRIAVGEDIAEQEAKIRSKLQVTLVYIEGADVNKFSNQMEDWLDDNQKRILSIVEEVDKFGDKLKEFIDEKGMLTEDNMLEFMTDTIYGDKYLEKLAEMKNK